MARHNLKSPEGIVRYANVFVPRARKGKNGEPQGEPKYSVLLVFERDADLTELEEAVEEAAVKKFGSNGKKLLTDRRFTHPIRDAAEYVDEELSKEENWPFNLKGAKMIRFSTTDKPGIVDEDATPIMDKTEFYDGCRARVSCRAFGYDTNGNKGVSFALVNVQKLSDGKRLSGNPSAEDEFGSKSTTPRKKTRTTDEDDLLG